MPYQFYNNYTNISCMVLYGVTPAILPCHFRAINNKTQHETKQNKTKKLECLHWLWYIKITQIPNLKSLPRTLELFGWRRRWRPRSIQKTKTKQKQKQNQQNKTKQKQNKNQPIKQSKQTKTKTLLLRSGHFVFHR